MIIIELKKEKDEIVKAAVVVGDAWPPNKAMPTGTECPFVKPDLLFSSVVILSYQFPYFKTT